MQKKFIKIGSYINWPKLQYIRSHMISYLECGDPTNKNIIICAHGLTRNAHDFFKIATRLKDSFRVIAITYPGRGDSEYFKNKKHYNYQVYTKDTLLFINKLGIKNPIWLGTSMGGIIGMVLASRYPKMLKGLVLNDIGSFIPGASLVKIARYAGQQCYFDNLNDAKQYLKMIYSQFGISDENDWDYLTKSSFILNSENKYQMNYDRSIIDGMRSNFTNPKDVDLSVIWHKVICPLLVIQGAKSEILQDATIEKMAQSRDFDLYRVEDVGHAPALMTDEQISVVKLWLSNL